MTRVLQALVGISGELTISAVYDFPSISKSDLTSLNYIL